MSNQILKIPEAGQKIIDSYLRMPINNKVIACPYYTNLKKIRGGLRVFLGKAPAQEIINEAKFISQKEHLDLSQLSEQELYHFMVEHNLGIDCSGLAVHILKEVYANFPISDNKTKKINILKKIKIVPFYKKPFRYLISKMRPLENISVRILADNKNSFEVNDFSDIRPGDMMIRTNLKHIYLVVKVEKENEMIKKISYCHAPRPKQKDYFGSGVIEKTVILEKNNLEGLIEKIQDQIIIRRLNFK